MARVSVGDIAVLLDTLPYIREFRRRTFVILVQGRALLDGHLEGAVARDVVLLRSVGVRPVVVHGGPAAQEQPSHSIETTGTAVQLVALLSQAGLSAVGLAGEDGGLASLSEHDSASERSVVINPDLVNELLELHVPVITPRALGRDGTPHVVNPVTFSASLASALGAMKLVFVGDTLWTATDGSPVSELSPETLNDAPASLTYREAVLAALAGGVESCHVVDGGDPHALLLELFTTDGHGTKIASGLTSPDKIKNDGLRERTG